MNQTDSLKLTTYAGERDRTQDGLLADELLELYARHRVHSSILLRGVEGFGPSHRLRTDRLLSLSEDLPVVSIAVDSRDRIEAMLGPLLQLQRRGLITVERVRLPSAEIGEVTLPAELGEATKLTVYLGRGQRIGGAPAHVAICGLLHRRGVDGASVLLGVDGTRGGRRTRASFFARNADVPVMIIAVGAGEAIAAALTELGRLLDDPLFTLERVRLCKRDGELLARPHQLPAADDRGRPLRQKLVVYSSRSVTHRGRPLSLEIVRRLRASDAAGATTLGGIWGFHGRDAPHGDRLLQARRRVPALTVTVDAPDRIASAFEIIDELTSQHGLVTSEMVPATIALDGTAASGAPELATHRF